MRVLLADVGRALGCGAHLVACAAPRSGRSGSRTLVPPDAATPLPIERAVAHLPRICVEPEEARSGAHGRILGPAGIEGPYAVFGPDGR